MDEVDKNMDATFLRAALKLLGELGARVAQQRGKQRGEALEGRRIARAVGP